MTAPDTNLGEVTYTRTYQAPRELVWECMTTPEHLTHFWGPTGVSTPLANIEIDLRPGGIFKTVMVDDASGAEYPMVGQYVEIEPPAKLVFSEPDVEGGMTTTMTFVGNGDGTTEVISHQTNVPEMFRSPEAQAGMQTSFDKFAAYLAGL